MNTKSTLRIFLLPTFKVIVTTFLALLFSDVRSQNIEGTITYNRKTDWISIMSRLPFVTEEEIERYRLVWRKDMDNGSNYNLYIKGSKSLYTYGDEDLERRWSWKKEPFILVRDQKSGDVNDWIGFLGKNYLIREKMQKRKWKILNEIKEIHGYLCMKAETKDTVKNQTIHAWFTDGIFFSGGAEGFGGLPGMILEIIINNGDVIVTATHIDLDQIDVKFPIPKKMKGKEISYIDFNSRVLKFVDQSIEGRRNPYWRIRY